jgi:AcrR family transcriptional regulator
VAASSIPELPAGAQVRAAATESLRERRRRELRQQLSEVATQLFLEHGFDAVHVADVARACGVTEKTVFNHFRTKEALLIDRWDDLIAALSEQLARRPAPAVTTVVQVLDRELDYLTGQGAASAEDMRRLVRFGQLVSSAPALLTYRGQELHRLASAILPAIAARRSISQDDPDAQITAGALAELVAVFYRSLSRHAPALDAARCRASVRRDTRAAARRLTAGLTD